jgi:translation initiation factor IF-3
VRPRRRFDQARPAQDLTRINEAIRVPRVRLVDSDGSQVGIKERDEALEYAYSKNLDLVEVAANADPPVCRIMDYGKYKYEQEQKAKTARKHQLQIHVKEIGQIESPPLQDGRNMVMVLGPTKNAGNPVPGATQNAKAEDQLEREEAI